MKPWRMDEILQGECEQRKVRRKSHRGKKIK